MKNMVHIIIATLVALAAGVSAETNKMSIAVLQLDANGVAYGEARALTDRLRSELFGVGRFDVLERDKMDALLTEQKLQGSGYTASRGLIELGRLINVNGIVSGSIGKLGAKYLLNARLVDVETGMILATAAEECACPLEELTAVLNRVAQRLANVEPRAEFTIQYYDKSGTAKGNFYIKSAPSGATVYINDKMIRSVVTPLTIEDLPAGTYRIRAEKDNFARTTEAVLQVNEFKKIDLVLEKKQGRLEVNSTVPQSDVYLFGMFAGKTPLVIPAMEVGLYQLQVKKAGYIEVNQQVKITDALPVRVDAVLIKPGPLKVLSQPMEAEVWLDGEQKGATPLVLVNLSPEAHALELRKTGYTTYRESITLTSDQETKIEPKLNPLPGTVTAAVKEKTTGVGSKFDNTMKWLTIGGGAAFAVVLTVISMQ
jgi:TolB-like protein